MFTFPAELSQAGRPKAARIVARYLVSTSAVAVDFSIHEPGKDGDERNHHCHMMFTTRRMTAKGLGEKTREWDDLKTGPKLSKALRKFIADTLNAELTAEGKADIARVEYRSFKARGSRKNRPAASGAGQNPWLRKKQGQARRAWEAPAAQGAAGTPRQGTGFAETPAGFRVAGQTGRLAQRGQGGRGGDPARTGRAAQGRYSADRSPARLPDRHPAGYARDFRRQARDGQRTAAENREINALIRDVQAERNAFVTGQTKDRAALIERHGVEDRQLTQAVISREFADKAAERSGRQREPRTRAIEQERQRGPDRGREPSP